jgi:bacteriocin biosynthesis cyclodehydratase domain-containing protein
MTSDPAGAAYAAAAPFYDRLTADQNHEAWVRTIDELARRHGLSGNRLLDLACGTGNTLVPFLGLGYTAAGCDLSPEMLAMARAKVGPDVRLFVGDMRSLEGSDRYDLVTCIGDVLNYLLDPREVVQTLRSVAGVLDPGGLCVFDVNTLRAYRSLFASDRCIEDEGGVITWRGRTPTDAAPGSTAEVVVDSFARENGHWTRATSRHVHRHHTDEEIRRAIADAGLSCVAVHGVTPDGSLHPEPRELEHMKRLYTARAPSPTPTRKGGTLASDREAGDAGRAGGRLHEEQLTRAGRPGAQSPRLLPRRPRLKQSIDLFPSSDGRLHLYRGGDEDFVVEDPAGEVRALLERLDGTRPVDELPHGAGATVRQLTELELVEDAASDEVLSPHVRDRYDRQLRYFGDRAPAGVARAEYQLRLQQARVVVLGLGGLGGWSALALATAGVGTIVAVDGDEVELSNLNRQVLFDEADIGRSKAAAAAERLRAYNSELHVETEACWLDGAEQIEELVTGADFVVDAVDTPVCDIERWVNAACFAAGVPYIAMSQFPPLVRIGPTFVPGRTGCYACQEAEWRDTYPLFDELAAHLRERPCPAASFGPACALIGGSVALDVAHHLTGLASPATLGRAVTIDMRTLETTRSEVPRSGDCAVCGGER